VASVRRGRATPNEKGLGKVNTRGRVLLLGLIVAASGASGFGCGYEWKRKRALEFVGNLARVPELKVADLAYAFAPSSQVRTLIEQEPPPQGEWAHTAKKVELLRKLRLAVVVAPSERNALLSEAEVLCEGCEPKSIRRMFQLYAQDRLVPPGDEIACDSCAPYKAREPLPPLD